MLAGAAGSPGAQRLLDDGRRECVEPGYLLMPVGLRCIGEGDAAGAYAAFFRAEIAERAVMVPCVRRDGPLCP